jgi:hypothetical protein
MYQGMDVVIEVRGRVEEVEDQWRKVEVWRRRVEVSWNIFLTLLAGWIWSR